MTKPNLERMYKALLDTYWMETSCLKAQHGNKCYEILRTREAHLCSQCAGYVRLKESSRLVLEDFPERRGATNAGTEH